MESLFAYNSCLLCIIGCLAGNLYFCHLCRCRDLSEQYRLLTCLTCCLIHLGPFAFLTGPITGIGYFVQSTARQKFTARALKNPLKRGRELSCSRGTGQIFEAPYLAGKKLGWNLAETIRGAGYQVIFVELEIGLQYFVRLD